MSINGKELSTIARFLSNINITDSGCWEWQGCGSDGYGFFWYKRNVRAHRFSYELFKGGIANGLELDHLCRNRKCVNPDHLEAVTHLENIRRGCRGRCKRSAIKLTHCPHGHPYVGDNIYFNAKQKTTACKICKRESNLRHRANKDKIKRNRRMENA